MLCAQGKVKMLDDLFCVRQIHPKRKILKPIKNLRILKIFVLRSLYEKILVKKILKMVKIVILRLNKKLLNYR